MTTPMREMAPPYGSGACFQSIGGHLTQSRCDFRNSTGRCRSGNVPMSTDDVIEVLGGWKTCSIEKIQVDKEKGNSQVWIDLTPQPGIARRCSGCGRRAEPIHEGMPRWVRDMAIIAPCQWPLHASLLEKINNKIKVIQRMACGYRDEDYFSLKIRAAFPGNTG